MHPAKRRRLEHTHLAPNKPFRSPLRAACNPSRGNNNNNQREPRSPQVYATASVPRSSLPASPAASPSSKGNETSFARPAALSQKLNQLRETLVAAEQALQIVTAHQNEQLQALSLKWKSIARDAADELFVDAKERVDGMGGLLAWQRRSRQDQTLWAEHNHRDDQALLQVDSRDSIEKDDMEEVDSESFTMEVMLRQMNVDLAVIGYDSRAEGWCS